MEQRLIDANALKEELNDYLEDAEITISDVLALLDNAPTVENERAKGEWVECGTSIEGYPVYQCSICHREIATFTPLLYKFPFCHCGADMRGEKNDKNSD